MIGSSSWPGSIPMVASHKHPELGFSFSTPLQWHLVWTKPMCLIGWFPSISYFTPPLYCHIHTMNAIFRWLIDSLLLYPCILYSLYDPLRACSIDGHDPHVRLVIAIGDDSPTNGGLLEVSRSTSSTGSHCHQCGPLSGRWCSRSWVNRGNRRHDLWTHTQGHACVCVFLQVIKCVDPAWYPPLLWRV